MELVDLSAAWPSGSERRFYDAYDRKVDGSTPTPAAFLDKMLHGNHLCLVESNKQQIEKVRSKTQAGNLETKATPTRVWIRPMYCASVPFSWQKDKNDEIRMRIQRETKTALKIMLLQIEIDRDSNPQPVSLSLWAG